MNLKFACNSPGELTTITNPAGNVPTKTYTPAHRIATITDAPNHATSYGDLHDEGEKEKGRGSDPFLERTTGRNGMD